MLLYKIISFTFLEEEMVLTLIKYAIDTLLK